jgi:hypothetical protein
MQPGRSHIHVTGRAKEAFNIGSGQLKARSQRAAASSQALTAPRRAYLDGADNLQAAIEQVDKICAGAQPAVKRSALIAVITPRTRS